MGNYRVLDSLTTLAFDYPPRSTFVTTELAEYLLIVRAEQLEADAPRGSYAGAMGAAQFMPSSLRHYAVDGDGDGHRDLWNNWADIFASIANYLSVHGWQRDEPVLIDAQTDEAPDDADPAKVRLVLNDTVATLHKRGYHFDTTMPETTKVLLVPAQLADAVQWRVGFRNFYTITRYNRSLSYAMAVHDLAQALAEGRAAQTAAPTPAAQTSAPPAR
jgi:membrane-bound lytic murein transglycosylase B